MTRHFSDDDLLLLIDILMPGHSHKVKMLKTLRGDEEILKTMIADEKLLAYLLENRESFIKASTLLFFTALLLRVKDEMRRRPYTVEKDKRQRMVVFDSGEVVDLLDEDDVLLYLARMLVSFTRITGFSVTTRVRKGVWRRFRFSDFDVESLIGYAGMIDEDHRFAAYKRIADLCLFIVGIFPGILAENELSGRRNAAGILPAGIMPAGVAPSGGMHASMESFTSRGKHFYHAAAVHKTAYRFDLDRVLERLSGGFSLAAKPLTHLSTHYLGFLKERPLL